MPRRRALLWAGWASCFGLGGLCLVVFLLGHLRDSHFEQAEILIDLGHPSAPQGTGFRVWEGGTWVLHLTTVNTRSMPGTFTPRDSMPRFGGSLEVRVRDPSGALRFERRYPPEELDHARPVNMEWTRLAELELGGGPLRAWELETRVVAGDERLGAAEGLRSEVLIRKDRPDPGMGGLINYVLLFPGLLFAGLAFVLALALARDGVSRIPVALTALLLVPVAIIWI